VLIPALSQPGWLFRRTVALFPRNIINTPEHHEEAERDGPFPGWNPGS
jgi:hypothetical protein